MQTTRISPTTARTLLRDSDAGRNPFAEAARARRTALATQLVAAIQAGVQDLSEALADASDRTGIALPKTDAALQKIVEEALRIAAGKAVQS